MRLFAVDLSSEEIAVFRTQQTDGGGDSPSWPLRDALGFMYLNEDFIDLFPVDDLEELGLTGYMVDGLGITQKDVAEDAARLSAQTGWVLVVLSAAFDGIAQTLSPKFPLRWIGTYREDGASVQFERLPDAGAKGAPMAVGIPAATTHRSPYLTLLLGLVFLPVVALVIGLLIMWIL